MNFLFSLRSFKGSRNGNNELQNNHYWWQYKFLKIKGKDQNNPDWNRKRRLTDSYTWLGLLVFTNSLFTCFGTKWQLNRYWFRSLRQQNSNSFWSIYTRIACHKYTLRAWDVIKESLFCFDFKIFNMAEALGLCHECWT